MTKDPANILLTPPLDSDPNPKFMDSDLVSYSEHQCHPLDDSSEDEASKGGQGSLSRQDQCLTDNSNQMAAGVIVENKILDETTISTTTTTTMTTTQLPKTHTVAKDALEGMVAHHQSVHQKYQPSLPLDSDGSDIGEDHRNAPSTSTISTVTIDTAKAAAAAPASPPAISVEADNEGIRWAPSASSETLSAGQSSLPPAQQQDHQHDDQGSQHDPSLPLDSSDISSASPASTRSNSSAGTPALSKGHHTISTTATIITKKRKVRRPTFEARSSRLDPEALTKNQDPFRGFHTLFWIVMGAYGLITFDEEWTKVGKAFGGTLFSSFSQDAIMLAISDFGLVMSTGIAFLLIKAVAKGWIRYKVTGMVIQHCVQVLFLLLAIAWTIWRDWPWVQSGFFTLHAITMLMKIHSYIAYNGELSEKSIQLKRIQDAYALMKKNDIRTTDDGHISDSADSNNKDSDVGYSYCTPGKQSGSRHHHRRASEAAAALLKDPSSAALTVDANLVAIEIDDLKSDLKCQNGELWPANVTVANFIDYLIVPSLIYELQYPRTSKIRPMYVFEKSVATLGTFTLLYLTTEHYIYPVVFDPTISPLRALVLLLIPFMMNYLMIFYIIFECICNAFAELSRFADRSFYEDWWNCVSFDEWARKWNKPVHHFLLRHVYDSSIESFHLSKSNAAFATFFLSSCVHELVMMVVTRKVRLYLFALQMCQLPLIWMGNSKTIRETPRLANAIFWLGMFCGPPLLGVAYCYA
ncbi:hypothetical protein BG011_008896 [Mortierella polycephala]|uniref:O-acyltransferase n=1 Tax=Mortierella polycephala TaxID=41804 RepID=A0A9P6Q958_9FUNG|nr:hypothetical protein BG011_008896 [Mortierella polycephala]